MAEDYVKYKLRVFFVNLVQVGDLYSSSYCITFIMIFIPNISEVNVRQTIWPFITW